MDKWIRYVVVRTDSEGKEKISDEFKDKEKAERKAKEVGGVVREYYRGAAGFIAKN